MPPTLTHYTYNYIEPVSEQLIDSQVLVTASTVQADGNVTLQRHAVE
jgi:hypothetical protein